MIGEGRGNGGWNLAGWKGRLWEQPAQPLEMHVASRHSLDPVFSHFLEPSVA